MTPASTISLFVSVVGLAELASHPLLPGSFVVVVSNATQRKHYGQLQQLKVPRLLFKARDIESSLVR